MGVMGIVAVAGAAMQARGAHKAKGLAKDIARFNQRVALEEAESTRESTQFSLRQAVREGKRLSGTQRAKMGASGARLDVGAPMRAEAELAQEIEIDQLLIAYEGEKLARRYENQATVTRMGGSLEAQQYQAKVNAKLLQGGATLLSQLSDYQRNFGGTGGASKAKTTVLSNQSAPSEKMFA